MNIYLEAEKQLAEALGWIQCSVHYNMDGVNGVVRGIPPRLQDPSHPDHKSIHRYHQVPAWCHNTDRNLELQIEHGVMPQYYNTMFMFLAYGVFRPVRINKEEHKDEITAYRYGVVLTVLDKFKEQANAVAN